MVTIHLTAEMDNQMALYYLHRRITHCTEGCTEKRGCVTYLMHYQDDLTLGIMNRVRIELCFSSLSTHCKNKTRQCFTSEILEFRYRSVLSDHDHGHITMHEYVKYCA
ncbi:hypothetical protein TNCV_1115751 [Trichonephila clavipes]|nr:hypothetical protein TNCV_1115751 [Trichonephila clavipes]